MIAFGIILYIVIGFGLGYCFLWVKDKFMIIDVRLDKMGAPGLNEPKQTDTIGYVENE
jgi:hypothetical protein